MLPIPRCLATLVHPRPPPQLLRLLGLPSLPKLAEIGRTTYQHTRKPMSEVSGMSRHAVRRRNPAHEGTRGVQVAISPAGQLDMSRLRSAQASPPLRPQRGRR